MKLVSARSSVKPPHYEAVKYPPKSFGAVLENGYLETPVIAGGKAVLVPKWNSDAIPLDLDRVLEMRNFVFEGNANPDYDRFKGRKHLNSGTRCKGLAVGDNDSPDPDTAEAINEILWRHMGPPAIHRLGRKPGGASFYRMESGLAHKIKVQAVDSEGRVHALEFLGPGAQIVCFGTVEEKDGEKWFYHWKDGESPLTVKRDDLTLATQESIVAVVKEVADLFDVLGYSEIKILGLPREESDSVSGAEGEPVTADQLREMLKAIPPDLSRQGEGSWSTVAGGLALIPVIEDGELWTDADKIALFVEWSRGDLTGEEVANFGSVADAERIIQDAISKGSFDGAAKAGSLIKLAQQHGYNGQIRESMLDRLDRINPANDNDDSEPSKGEAPKPESDPMEDPDADFVERLRTKLKAKFQPYQTKDPKKLPAIPFLYGRSAVRGELGVILAAAGTGKTSAALMECYDMTTEAIGLEPLHKGPLRVGFESFEDQQIVLDQRIEGLRLYHEGGPDVFGDRFFMSTMIDLGLKLTRSDGGVIRVDERVFAILAEIIRDKNLDVLILDPWVNCHDFPESANTEIANLAARIHRLAVETGCFVCVIHHVRKGLRGAVEDLTADDSRGASSLVGKARIVRGINRMTAKEASAMGVPEGERWRYVRISDLKANLAEERVNAKWFRKESIFLDNAEQPEDFPEFERLYQGDSVVAMRKVEFAAPVDVLTYANRLAIFQALTEKPRRASIQAAEGSRMIDLVADVCGLPVTAEGNQERLKSIIKRLEREGLIVAGKVKDEKSNERAAYLPGKPPVYDGDPTTAEEDFGGYDDGA